MAHAARATATTRGVRETQTTKVRRCNNVRFTHKQHTPNAGAYRSSSAAVMHAYQHGKMPPSPGSVAYATRAPASPCAMRVTARHCRYARTAPPATNVKPMRTIASTPAHAPYATSFKRRAGEGRQRHVLRCRGSTQRANGASGISFAQRRCLPVQPASGGAYASTTGAANVQYARSSRKQGQAGRVAHRTSLPRTRSYETDSRHATTLVYRERTHRQSNRSSSHQHERAASNATVYRGPKDVSEGTNRRPAQPYRRRYVQTRLVTAVGHA